MARPALIAQALLDELGIKGAPDIRTVANLLGVEIEEAEVDGFDGALVRLKGSTQGMIAVRQTIRETGKKNFTIAHELGHLLLPGHDESIVCMQTDVETWHSGLSKQELEANEFAGELLMPTAVLTGLLSDWKPSFDLVEALASRFSTSLTATAYRCVEVTGHACALVWSEAGATKWFKRSEEFKHWVRLRERLDSRTLASDCFGTKSVPAAQERVAAAAWLDGTIPEDALVLEHTRCMSSYEGALTLLWLQRPFVADSKREEDALEELDPKEFGMGRQKWPTKR